MHQASVGFHCPECVRTSGQKVVRGIPTEKPLLTYAFIALNVAVFLLGVALDGGDHLSGSRGGIHIDFGLIARGLVSDGRSVSLVGVSEGEWYRLLTSGFLHYGAIHLGMNMFAVYILGRALEPAGRVRFGLIYVSSLFAGSLGALFASPENTLTAGASGAVFGLMGAVFMGHRSMGVNWRDSPLLNVLVLNLIITFAVPNISVGGHIGGLIGGALCGFLAFDIGRRPGFPQALVDLMIATVGVAAVIGSIAYVSTL